MDQIEGVTQHQIMSGIVPGLLIAGIVALIGAMISLIMTQRQLITSVKDLSKNMNGMAKDVDKATLLAIKIWDIHNVRDGEGRPVWWNDHEVRDQLKELTVLQKQTLQAIRNGNN